MSKKDKPVFALADDFQTMITMIPKLAALLKVLNEITAGYQKYRKNGGASIPGIEKHIGLKEQKSASSSKIKKTASLTKTKVTEGTTETTKEKKKVKK
jgi:hypothetical protein